MTVHALPTLAPRDRPPPHSLEAERSVLGGVLIKPTALAEVRATLDIDDFFLPAHREVYDAMVAVEKRAVPVDVVLVADELRARGVLDRLDGGEGYLLSLSNSVPTAENIAHYARLVKEKARARRFIALVAEAQARAYQEVDVIDDLMAEHSGALLRLDSDRRSSLVPLAEMLSPACDVMEDRGDRPEDHGVPSGLEAFERKIGRFREEQLVIVASRPGGGKSSWALGVALRAAAMAAIPCAFFSLEMGRQELAERTLSFASTVTGHDMARGNLDYAAWRAIREAAAMLSALPVAFDAETFRVDRIVANLTAWRYRQFAAAGFDPADKRKPAPRALGVVDYLQLVQGDRRDGRATEVADISRELKLAAKRLRMPIIACAQLNRDLERGNGDAPPRKPRLSDIRESGGIEADADMVIFPWEETYLDQPTGQRLARHMLLIAKHRGGPIGRVRVNFLKERMMFRDVPAGADDSDENDDA